MEVTDLRALLELASDTMYFNAPVLSEAAKRRCIRILDANKVQLLKIRLTYQPLDAIVWKLETY